MPRQSAVEAIMVAAITLAGAIFWHVIKRSAAAAPAAAPAATDEGLPLVRLGQNAVAPDRWWLLIPRGM
jgi:hypothetical protein